MSDLDRSVRDASAAAAAADLELELMRTTRVDWRSVRLTARSSKRAEDDADGSGSATEKRATVWLPTESSTSCRPRAVTRRSRVRVLKSASENALRRLLIADDIFYTRHMIAAYEYVQLCIDKQEVSDEQRSG